MAEVGSEQPRFLARASYLLREALDADAFELAGGGMGCESWQQRLQVAACLPIAALGGGRDRADEVGALQPSETRRASLRVGGRHTCARATDFAPRSVCDRRLPI
ncbi:MAG: hypothetical protein H0T10_07060 [Actinobacteria bacterium]|nr:hypothetical protein [Actinomycetota bacterium]